MKLAHTLPALLLLLASVAQADAQKSIYCERNEMDRDGAKNVALFHAIDGGRVIVSAYSLSNVFGRIHASNYIVTAFPSCKLSARSINCSSAQNNGNLESLELGTQSSPQKLSYSRVTINPELPAYRTSLELAPSDCREVDGEELIRLIHELESGDPVHSSATSAAKMAEAEESITSAQ